MLALLQQFLTSYGYLAVTLIVLIECVGIPLPGETILLLAAAYAGAGQLDIRGVILAAAVGAIVGDTIGYWLGRLGGRAWLERYGHLLRINQRHLACAEGFFARHGESTVFFGRFVAVVRIFIALLAGINRMPYGRFLIYNAAGGVLWALVIGLLGAAFGTQWSLLERWLGRAGLLILAILVLVAALVLLWRWIVGHETRLRLAWAAWLNRPWVKAFRTRFARQLAFLQARFSPKEYLGLHLTIGLALIVTGVWLFSALAEDVATRESIVQVDLTVSQWLHAHAEPPFTIAMQIISFAGYQLVIVLSLVVGVLWLVRRQWDALTMLLIAVGGGGILNLILKDLFARQRPVFTDPLVRLTDYSFPSGHAMGSMLCYGLMAYLVARSVAAWRWRTLALLAATLLVLLVGFSRIYLGAHFLSDVLGAYAAGFAWLAFTITGVNTVRNYRVSLAQNRALAEESS